MENACRCVLGLSTEPKVYAPNMKGWISEKTDTSHLSLSNVSQTALGMCGREHSIRKHFMKYVSQKPSCSALQRASFLTFFGLAMKLEYRLGSISSFIARYFHRFLTIPL